MSPILWRSTKPGRGLVIEVAEQRIRSDRFGLRGTCRQSFLNAS